MGDFERWKRRYLHYVDKCIGYVPYKRMAEWKEFFLDPISVISKGPSTVMERFKDLMFITLLGIIVGLIGQGVPMLLLSLFNPFNLILLAFIFGTYVVSILITPAMYTAYFWFEHQIAKLLGGTADFKTHFNATVLPMLAMSAILLPIFLIYIPLIWLMYIPFAACCAMPILIPFSLFSMGLWAYSIYQKFLVLRHVHNLDDVKTAGVIVLPVVVLCALIGIIVVIFYAAVVAWILGASGSLGSLTDTLPTP